MLLRTPAPRPEGASTPDAGARRGRGVPRTLAVALLSLVVAAGTLLAPGTASARTASAAQVAAAAPGVDARVARKGSKLVVRPRTVSNGKAVRLRGKVPAGPRKVTVQIRYGKGGWRSVVTKRTRRTGTFNIRVVIAVPASVTRAKVRVKAPRAKVRGKKRATAVTPTRTVVVRPGAPATAQERAVLTIVNRERASAGCGPLAMETRLLRAARGHSADMAARNYFSHDSQDGRTFRDRIEAAGYRDWTLIGENIAAGQRTAQEVMTAWMNSEGHRKNILNCRFTEIGVGHVVRSGDGRAYWTQDFGRR